MVLYLDAPRPPHPLLPAEEVRTPQHGLQLALTSCQPHFQWLHPWNEYSATLTSPPPPKPCRSLTPLCGGACCRPAKDILPGPLSRTPHSQLLSRRPLPCWPASKALHLEAIQQERCPWLLEGEPMQRQVYSRSYDKKVTELTFKATSLWL